MLLHDGGGRLERCLGVAVLEEVDELGVVVADVFEQRHRVGGHPLGLDDLVGGQAALSGDLLDRRLAPEGSGQPGGRPCHLGDGLDHVHGHTDGAALVGDGTADRLADPPGGVCRELEALAVLELLDSPDEAQVPLLHEVEERET